MSYTLQAIGKHWALTSLLTLAATHAMGLDDDKTIRILADFGELDGRGRLLPIPVEGGMALLIDDSYNASPAAMRAAFSKTAEVWESGDRKGRKLAALGNMLELGADTPSLHSNLGADIERAGFDKVFTAGEHMKHLHDALPQGLRAGHVAQAMQLLPLLEKELRAGDILLLKGSHGSKMYQLAKALSDKASTSDAGKKTCCITCSYRLPGEFGPFNLFRYLTFRSGGAVFTALLLSFLFRAQKLSAG